MLSASSVDAMAGPDNEHLAAMRKEYGSKERDGSPDLDVDWLDDGWLALLRKWIGEAERGGVAEPNAMVLATVESGRPVSRSVLCKGVDEDGIVFFSNYDSAKGEQLAADAVRLGDLPVVPAEQAVPYPRAGHQSRSAGHRELLEQPATRLAVGRVGVTPVRADRRRAPRWSINWPR